jgi:hypothetical protein
MNKHATEYLKGFVAKTLEAFQSGSGSVDHPVTMEVALASIWREIDLVAQSESPRAFRDTLWLRVRPNEDAADVQWPLPKRLATVRCIGPRKEGHQPVYYVTYGGVSMEQAYAAINDLRRQGHEVRDFHYGCFRV